MWIGGLTDIGLMLLGLAIVAAFLVGGTLPSFGGVVSNIIGLVAELGKNGLARADRRRDHPVAVLQALDGLSAGLRC